MKAERIQTEKAGKWDGTFPVLMTHKVGTDREMVVLFTSNREGTLLSCRPSADQLEIGYHSESWTTAEDGGTWTYLPETEVIVLSNKES